MEEAVAVEQGQVEIDPAAELARVRQEKDKWQGASVEVAEHLGKLEEQEAALNHQLACQDVESLFFEHLDSFAALFQPEGAVYEGFQNILQCLVSLAEHDPAWLKNLTGGVYDSIISDHAFREYWFHFLSSVLDRDGPLHKALMRVFQKPTGSPFEYLGNDMEE